MKKFISKFLILTFIVSLFAGFSTYAASDISGHWAENVVSKWIEAGKIKGYSDGSFKPNNNMTRAEFATVLASVINIQIAEYPEFPFSDVKENDWYYENIRKLLALQVVAPSDNFYPDSYITRQDVMTMAGRAFYYTTTETASLEKFSDFNLISDYAKEFVAALVEAGSVSGYEDNTIRPLNNITRAECVKILDGFNVVKDPYSLGGIMDRLYEEVDEEIPNTMQMEINKENSEFFVGIPEMDFEEAIASEPMMGSIAHSICLIKVKDGTDIEKVKAEIKEKVNPRKWICVGVDREDVIVINKGNIILLVIDQIAPKKFEAAFNKINVEKMPEVVPDANGIISYNGMYMDYIGEMRTAGVQSTADKIEKMANKYKDNRVFYSVIPSKSYFINDSLKNPFDYSGMFNILNSTIKSAKYIDVTNTLSLNDYYVTDPHFKQDKLDKFVAKLGEGLGFNIDITKNNLVNIPSFVGQHGAKINDINSESINYMTNSHIDGTTVTNIMGDPSTLVYNTEKLSTSSQYDFFLSGPSPIKVLKNPNAPETNRLVIFNDSYSCTVAPLLAEHYNEIIMIDLRYVASILIEDYVWVGNADILFLYNEQIVNNGEMLKVIG